MINENNSGCHAACHFPCKERITMSDNLNDSFNSAADAAKDAAEQAASAVQQGATSAADAVSSAASKAADATADAAEKAADAASSAAGSASKSTRAAVDELTQTVERLSNEVANSARTAWESEQRKEIQDSVIRGLTGIAAAIEEQVKKLSETDDAKRFTAKMEETTDRITDQVKSSRTFQDIADGLVKGFSAAAVSLEKWLGQQDTAKKSGEGASATVASVVDEDGTQSIIIENRSAIQPPVAPPSTTGAADDELSAPDSTVHF